MYRILDGKVYRVDEVTTKVNLTRMKRELERLKAMEPPTLRELAELGQQCHPYYQEREARIDYLEAQIAQIEALIGTREA